MVVLTLDYYVTPETDSSQANGYRAVENIYHRWLTGLILRAVVVRGSADAAALVFRLFRRQHEEKFLPGLTKLGLDDLPDAVKCAQYHYLSNYLGDVNVEYVRESDRKAWVRYPPPRWIWDGTAICGIPSEVSKAMLLAWHSYNGVTLGNPRLGYVCTKQTVDGQPGLEGYFIEHDHELAPEERLRIARGEEAPDFDPTQAPSLGSETWPEVRLQKALRNYAMEYVRNVLPELIGLFGPVEGAQLGRMTGMLIGMQYYAETAELLEIEGSCAATFAELLVRFARAQGDSAEWSEADGGAVIHQSSARVLQVSEPVHHATFEAWNGLWEGALSVHNRRLKLETRYGDGEIEWRIRP